MKKKRFSLIVCLATLFALAPSLRSQAVYTAVRSSRIQAGVGVTLIQTDYTPKDVEGISAWADYDLSKWYGLEGAVHISVLTPDDWSENTFEIGLRGLYHYRKFILYAKGLAGLGHLTPQDYLVSIHHYDTQSSGMFSVGGGLDYRFKQKLTIRCIDIEQQVWTNFEPNNLTPLAVTIGASYIIR